MSEPLQTFKNNLGWLGAALFVGGVVGVYYVLYKKLTQAGVGELFIYSIRKTNIFTDMSDSFYQDCAPLYGLIKIGIVLMMIAGLVGLVGLVRKK
jgi:hypothetical protein